MRRARTVPLTLFVLLLPGVCSASGHGPVFGLATPTLGKGHASFDFAIMSNRQSGGSSLMRKYLWGYGIVESLAEFPKRNTINGTEDPNSGGSRLLLGPTVLGLYGDWGVSGGVLFPVYQRLNGNQSNEKARMMITVTYWI